MAERLKDQFFTEESLQAMTKSILKAYPSFQTKEFLKLIYDPTWEQLELKQKMRHTTECLKKVLPQDYKEAIKILMKAAPEISGFEAMTLPDYVELYGLENWDLSFEALAHFTRFSSSEFAIRPFLAQKPQISIDYMFKLADHPDENVRRFASEGCRPRLPWAMALPVFKKDPSPILPILEKLKDDESEYVRRSVANNLNDISKDNPEILLELAEKWKGQSKNIDAIIKHACRSLLKAGNPRALVLFGFISPKNLFVENLSLEQTKMAIGETLHFSFSLLVKEGNDSKIRLEYAIYYMKSNGKLSKKVFQISEKNYKQGDYTIKRKHSFADMTTRKHYKGRHEVAAIVNGVEKAKAEFELI